MARTARTVNKCGKKLHRAFFHVSPSGERTQAPNLAAALEMARTQGGGYEQRSWRE